jgi:hypothetical protein
VRTAVLDAMEPDMRTRVLGVLPPNVIAYTPKYPDVAEIWLSAAGLTARMNFAASIVSGQVPGVKVDTSRWKGTDNAAIARALLGREASKQTLDAIGVGLEGKDPSPGVIASLVLGSPDFERR